MFQHTMLLPATRLKAAVLGGTFPKRTTKSSISTPGAGLQAVLLLTCLPLTSAIPTFPQPGNSSSPVEITAGNGQLSVELDSPLLLIVAIGLITLIYIRHQKQISQQTLGTVTLASAVGGLGWAAVGHELRQTGHKSGTLISLCIILWANLVGCCMRCLEQPWWHFTVAVAVALSAIVSVAVLPEDMPSKTGNGQNLSSIASIARQSAFLFATLADLVAYGVQDFLERRRQEITTKTKSPA